MLAVRAFHKMHLTHTEAFSPTRLAYQASVPLFEPLRVILLSASFFSIRLDDSVLCLQCSQSPAGVERSSRHIFGIFDPISLADKIAVCAFLTFSPPLILVAKSRLWSIIPK